MKADTALIQAGTDDTHYVTPKGVGVAGIKFVSQWLSNNYAYYSETLSMTEDTTKTYNINASIEIHACIIIIADKGSVGYYNASPSPVMMLSYGESKSTSAYQGGRNYGFEASLSSFVEGSKTTLTIKMDAYYSGYILSYFVI